MHLTQQTQRILIADDHPVMRQGLRLMIEQQPDLRVIAEAADGSEAISLFRTHRPDATLMDLRMPGVDGFGAIRAIRDLSPNAAVVVLTTYRGDARASAALALGASAYVSKTSTSDEIIQALRGALCGRTILASDVREDLRDWKGAETLTAREVSVLRLVAEGKQNRLIGAELNISEHTVKSRIKSILSKLVARDRTHAVTIATRRGFLGD